MTGYAGGRGLELQRQGWKTGCFLVPLLFSVPLRDILPSEQPRPVPSLTGQLITEARCTPGEMQT